jgi:hypothetical protein
VGALGFGVSRREGLAGSQGRGELGHDRGELAHPQQPVAALECGKASSA